MKVLSGQRILVCGKGGSGKSSIITLFAKGLSQKGYKVVLLDADASNPSGLCRLVLGSNPGPKPLIEFFGGRAKVECPVDNPEPLVRMDISKPVTESHLELSEIPSAYYVQDGQIILFQVGKINNAYEGCDGPMSKVARDFILDGDYITLIDVEAGIEHFGRGVEQNVDAVIIIVNPTFESIQIAERVFILCEEMGIPRVSTILNGFQTQKIRDCLIEELKKRKIPIDGMIAYDPDIQMAGMLGNAIGTCKAQEAVREIVEKIEHDQLSETLN